MPRYGGIVGGVVLPCGAGIAGCLPEKEFNGPVREAIVALSGLKNAGGGDIGVILSAGDVCDAAMNDAGEAKGTGVCGSTGIPICCPISAFCCWNAQGIGVAGAVGIKGTRGVMGRRGCALFLFSSTMPTTSASNSNTAALTPMVGSRLLFVVELFAPDWLLLPVAVPLLTAVAVAATVVGVGEGVGVGVVRGVACGVGVEPVIGKKVEPAPCVGDSIGVGVGCGCGVGFCAGGTVGVGFGRGVGVAVGEGMTTTVEVIPTVGVWVPKGGVPTVIGSLATLVCVAVDCVTGVGINA